MASKLDIYVTRVHVTVGLVLVELARSFSGALVLTNFPMETFACS
jgi:hypothetical protein